MTHSKLKEGDELAISMGFKKRKLVEGETGSEWMESMKNAEWVEGFSEQIHIMAEAKEVPIGVSEMGFLGSNIQVLVNDETFERLEQGCGQVEEAWTREVASAQNEVQEYGYEQSAYWERGLHMVFADEGKAAASFENFSKEMDDSRQYVFHHYAQSERQERQFLALLSLFAYGFIALISLICTANIFNTITTSFQLRRREFAMLRSVGMTRRSFRKMVAYESLFYGIRALSVGLPVGILIMLLIYRVINDNGVGLPFSVAWGGIAIVVFAVFAIVGSSMAYSFGRLKGENVIDALKLD